jgi:hypothetical protein
VAEAAFDLSRTAIAQCPQCPKTGSPRGIKHHFTSMHADGESGRLAIAYAAVSRRDLRRLQETVSA